MTMIMLKMSLLFLNIEFALLHKKVHCVNVFQFIRQGLIASYVSTEDAYIILFILSTWQVRNSFISGLVLIYFYSIYDLMGQM